MNSRNDVDLKLVAMEIKLIEPRDPALIPPVNSQGSRQPKKYP
jgi:hypothetical protein